MCEIKKNSVRKCLPEKQHKIGISQPDNKREKGR